MALNMRQRLFAHEYVRDFNATQAAIRAGYSPRTAGAQGHRLLKNVEIQNEISKVYEEVLRGSPGEKIKIIRHLTEVVLLDPREAVEWGPDGVTLKESKDLPDHIARAVEEVAETAHGVKIKFSKKLEAAAQLEKIYGMLVDKVEHSGGQAITITMTGEQRDQLERAIARAPNGKDDASGAK